MAKNKMMDIWYVKPAREEGGKGYWMKIGVCWTNKDGSLSPKFDVIPPNMDNIVIREHQDKESKGQSFDDE